MMLAMSSVCISSVLLLLLLLVLMTDCTDESHSCIFDLLRPRQVPSTNAVYSLDLQSFRREKTHGRRRRQASLDDLFAPIRVAYFFFQMELEVDEQEKLKSVINKSVVQIESIFSVIPVTRPLLLRRHSGCQKVLAFGNNTGRCTLVQRRYRGELCADEFQIPDDHLEGLFVWNSTHSDPVRTVFHDGRGVDGTDFILYVQSVWSPRCNWGELNVIAYATYCHTDQNGRPIAAYINICPQMIRENSNKLSITVLHELFHALGFSSDRFSSFKRCFLTGNGSVACVTQSSPVRYVYGAQRLVTNRVAEMTSSHLNCSLGQTASTFGAILQTEDGEPKSHWDAAFLHGSLMMPTVLQPYLTFLDNITLALFEDSGWYRVNYSYAQDLHWGKGEGCGFGLESSCQDEESPFFCQQRSTGCHYLRLDKGTCETNPFLHGCRIYNPKPEDSCQLRPVQFSSDSAIAFGESFGPSSRCFRTNLTREVDDVDSMQLLEGRCLKHWCNATRHLFVSLGDDWIFCPAGTLLKVAGMDGVIECPREGVLCAEPWPLASTQHPFTTVFSSNSTASSNRGNRNDFLRFELSFDSLPVFDHNNTEEMKELEQGLRQRIQLTVATEDNAFSISNVTLIWDRNAVQFTVGASAHRTTPQLDLLAVLELLTREVDAENFSISFNNSIHIAKAIRLLSVGSGSDSSWTTSLSPLPTVSQLSLSHGVSSGLISAIAIGSVVGFVVITVVVVLFARCCLMRQHTNHKQSLSTEPSFQASVV